MSLKIAINTRRIETSFGGGNNFVKYMEKFLIDKGCAVYRKLVPNLDVILLIQAEPHLSSVSFDPCQIAIYRKINPEVLVIQRINTADEPRGKDLGINKAVFKANRTADYSVFVSNYVRELFIRRGFDPQTPHCVIHTGADKTVFNDRYRKEIKSGELVKVVTHHWSDNYLKGFDIYERLDNLIGSDSQYENIEFTLIGNRPLCANFKNSRLLDPLHGRELATELAGHDFYVTGARCEPAGNHYIEAMSCGLPVLYLDSGSSGEYCSTYGGVGYDLSDFESKFILMKENLMDNRDLVKRNSYSARDMAEKYWNLINHLVLNRQRKRHPSSSRAALSFLKAKIFWNRTVDKIIYEMGKLKIRDDL